MARFGRNIGEDKVVYLAIKAETEGYQEFADGFWNKAYAVSSNKAALAPTDDHSSTMVKQVNESALVGEHKLVDKTIDIKRRRLKVLEEQKAYYGLLPPAYIVLEIEDLHRELAAYDDDKSK